MPAKVGPKQKHKKIGPDQIYAYRNALHLLALATILEDRTIPRAVIEFLTGTRWDHTSSRTDDVSIGDAAKRLGHRPLGSLAEHLTATLTHENELLDRTSDLAAGKPTRQEIVELERLRKLVILIDGLPYGPPTRHHRASAGTLYVGRDHEAVAGPRGQRPARGGGLRRSDAGGVARAGARRRGRGAAARPAGGAVGHRAHG